MTRRSSPYVVAAAHRIGRARLERHAVAYGFCYHPELGYQVRVEHTGRTRHDDTWAIRLNGTRCLSRSGEWVYEPIPSSRDDDWLAVHRFTVTEALVVAYRLEARTDGAAFVNMDEATRVTFLDATTDAAAIIGPPS